MESLRPFHVGLISDTHGLLRVAALDALRGSDLIVHAGDIGGPTVLSELSQIAPVRAVRGNNDRGPWAEAIPATDLLEIGATLLYVLHDLGELDIDPIATGCRIVVTGHSHRPAHEIRDGVHFVNPGSAGPRRFSLPVSVGKLTVVGVEVEVQLLELS